jgi:hypothetical protein
MPDQRNDRCDDEAYSDQHGHKLGVKTEFFVSECIEQSRRYQASRHASLKKSARRLPVNGLLFGVFNRTDPLNKRCKDKVRPDSREYGKL